MKKRKRLAVSDKNNINYLAQIETSESSSDASLLFSKTRDNFEFIINLIKEKDVILLEKEREAEVGDDVYPTLEIRESKEQELNLKLKADKRPVYEGENVKWIVKEATIHPFRDELADLLPGSISLGGTRRGEFVFEILPRLKEQFKIQGGEEFLEYELLKQEPGIKLEFDYQEEMIICKARVEIGGGIYTNSEILGFDLENKHYRPLEGKEKVWQAWDTEEIGRVLKFLEDYNFYVQPERFYIKRQQDIQNFLVDGWPHLPEEWSVETTSAFDNLEVVEVELEPEIDFDDGQEIDWFEFEVSYEIDGKTYHRAELEELLSYNQQGTAYFQQEGKYFVLQSTHQEEQVERLISQAEEEEAGRFRTSRYNLLYYRRLIEKAGIKFDGSEVYDELNRDITEDRVVSEEEVPPGVEDVLRDYQREGYYWLKFLHKYKFGGVLADDMGLGKTLQALTLLKKVELKEPALVVCPRSLIYNWGLEIDKFFPEFNYLVYHDTPEERAKMREQFDEYDILITSYSIISRDCEKLQEFEFSYCILDEAHHIKNRKTQKARGAKQIRARHKLALTGTPLENSLKELWSIFDFLMPGYLENYSQFRKEYLRPISKEDNRQKLEELKDKIAPFILRRTKEEVLSDLPDKLVNIHQVELTRTQEECYRTVLKQVRGELEETVKERGFSRSRINVLAALTKLRQICDHPKLVIEEPGGELDSAKLEVLLEIVEDALEAGHKLVVFSQFVRMLKIIKQEFKEKEIGFSYLDGSTRKRIEEVKEFNQNPERKVFLISLKAGGTGLNLTAADMVVHVDPWWNPMVERQASDRVHRIGQENKVVIYKLIAAGTVEEKMLKLKKSKEDMFERIIEDSESPLENISWQDMQELLSYK